MELSTLCSQVLQVGLTGGGRRATQRQVTSKRTARRTARRTPPRTAQKQQQQQQLQLMGAGTPLDVDVLLQQFNHTGTVRLPRTMTPEQVTVDVVSPLVRHVLQSQFPHAQGHRLTDVVQQRGHTVPPSVESAKQELEQFKTTTSQLGRNWEKGIYTTVDALVASSPNAALTMELFACVSMLMDSYSQLNTQDLELVLPALFACALVLRDSLNETTLQQWTSNPYAPAHLSAVDKLKREIGRIKSSQGQAVRGGGASSALDMSRNLLALNTALVHKQELVRGYEQAIGNGAAPAADSSRPPTSLASSILGASPPLTVRGAAPEAPEAAAATEEAFQAAFQMAKAPRASEASEASEASDTPKASETPKASAQAPQAAAHAKVKQMYMQGGVPRQQMKHSTVVGKDLGGKGVHLYAYLQNDTQMAVDFMLEELDSKVSPEMRKRLDYLQRNRKRISDAISKPNTSDAKRQLALDVGKQTDDQLANVIHSMLQ